MTMMLHGQEWLVADIIHVRKDKNIHNSQDVYATQCNLSGPGKYHFPNNGNGKQKNEAVQDHFCH